MAWVSTNFGPFFRGLSFLPHPVPYYDPPTPLNSSLISASTVTGHFQPLYIPPTKSFYLNLITSSLSLKIPPLSSSNPHFPNKIVYASPFALPLPPPTTNIGTFFRLLPLPAAHLLNLFFWPSPPFFACLIYFPPSCGDVSAGGRGAKSPSRLCSWLIPPFRFPQSITKGRFHGAPRTSRPFVRLLGTRVLRRWCPNLLHSTSPTIKELDRIYLFP